MKGTIFYQKDRGRWAVSWPRDGKRGSHVITRYKGEFMYHEKIAQKCLGLIQNRWEESQQGLCRFRLEEFTGKGFTDVVEYYEFWMQNVIELNRKPATIKGYWSYLHNWIAPFFKTHNIMLHEVKLDTLTALLNSITLTGKGKMNVMMALRSMMDYAHRSERIQSIPPFPKRSEYGIVEPTIKWLSSERQMAIINAIPEVHRPIFLWLKYHYRRPAEACALKWEDYDRINEAFIIRRSISARTEVESTKTGVEHIIPCHSEFSCILKGCLPRIGSYIFTNVHARRKSKRYTNESLNTIWRKACGSVGESIDLYSGLKHSSCSQCINEDGMSIYDIQALTQHERLESVKKYAKTEMSRIRELMNRHSRITTEVKTGIKKV